MEATNISIKQQSSVSINVETLQAIKQRVLQAVKQATKKYCNVGAWSLPRLYRKELRLARAIARAIDAHPTLSNIVLWVQTFVGVYLIFMYA
ncbi:MAG: hypothetical protein II728_03965 [Bacteroidaceae bacterium]|nr:hypothetical protein [Bacteroidaceae bacterium]